MKIILLLLWTNLRKLWGSQDSSSKRFMMLAVIGNHDVVKWFEPRTGYRDLLTKQYRKSGLERHCNGEYGVNMYCVYNDMVNGLM